MFGSATATIVELSGINIVPSAAVTRTARSLGPSARMALTLARLLSGAEPLREGLQEVPRDRPVAFDERAEVPVGKTPADEVRRRRDGCRARALVDHRELAER